MQLYQVTTREGALIMNAPIEIITKIFSINSVAESHIIRHTQTLGRQYWYYRPGAEDTWWPDTLVIERLPLDIPHPKDSPKDDPKDMWVESAIAPWDEDKVNEFLTRLEP
jgi:hypothetical protein